MHVLAYTALLFGRDVISHSPQKMSTKEFMNISISIFCCGYAFEIFGEIHDEVQKLRVYSIGFNNWLNLNETLSLRIGKFYHDQINGNEIRGKGSMIPARMPK